MNVKTILAKLATRSATDILKVMDWILDHAETHWSAEIQKHTEAIHRNQGTSMAAKAEAAYSAAFDNWHTIRQTRDRISKPVRLLGGRLRRVA